MTINVLSLFPEIIQTYTNTSIIGRAVKKKQVEINIYNLRGFGVGERKTVDGKPYGGGGGMVLRVDVCAKAIKGIRAEHPKTTIILLCPTGKTYTQKTAQALAKRQSITLICGHYQGYDRRIYSLVDEVISIGSYITTGGETAALAILDSVVRLQPGVINPESLKGETFSNNLTEAPLYTEPADFEGNKIPEILLSGHHAEIEKFRLKLRRKTTPKS